MAEMKDEKDAIKAADDSNSSDRGGVVSVEKGELINASGHTQQLDRNFNLVSLA